MLYDFHTHTFHSDGILSPIELIRRAFVKGYSAIGITDHVAIGSLGRVIKEISDDCALARTYWDILAIPGVELTHVPPQAISEVAKKAKEMGAWLVVVHGETSAEPVAKGTNLAAVQSPDVDILAHPGPITAEEASLAAQNNVFIELTARRGHSTANAHVALISQKAKAKLLVSSDAHSEKDLLTPNSVESILRQANINPRQHPQILHRNPKLLIEKVNRSSSHSG
ncbi:MAG: histidinol phosphate phosphatase domain-containing protein [Chloroflexi bacterium]|nr:histidinol phosphate phosphatase domain-containing protein [Chloroflexota bacterium]MBL7061658.1 histidinol phosphate phosphatase domain-containing protein [Dehalococcoidia bacterium]